MTRLDDALARASAVIVELREWVEDPESDVVHVEADGTRPLYEPGQGYRFAVRMRQRVRDATTVWVTVGERTARFEAYLLPVPDADPGRLAEAFRQCLVRNGRTLGVHLALDRHGDLVIVGRVEMDRFDVDAVDGVLGEVHELVDLAFPALVRTLYARGPATDGGA